MQFQLNVVGKEGNVTNIKIQLDNYAEINIPMDIEAGETIICDGTATIRMYDKNGKLKNTQQLQAKLPMVAAGNHTIIIDCTFGGEDTPKIEMQFKGIRTIEKCTLVK